MDPQLSERRVGYVVSRFPKLSETFILREMMSLQDRLGWDVELFPLMVEDADVIHPAALPWLSRAHRLPWISTALVVSNVLALCRSPRACVGVWVLVLRGYAGSPQALARALVLLPRCVHLARLVRRHAIPQLHAHFATYPLLACWVVHRLTGTPYSVTIHAHDIFTGTPMLAEKLRTAGAVVTISEFNRRYLAEAVAPELLEGTDVIRCGVEPDVYSRPERERATGTATILCIGSLQQYKGQTHLVEACRQLVEAGRDVRCLLVGHGPDEAALRRQTEAAGLTGVITFLGARTEREVAQLLVDADLYVQPSVIASDGQMEGIPVALMEALASRLPVVATALSGVPELVRDGVTGRLVPSADPRALASVMAEVLDHPGDAAVRASAGRSLVEQEFELHSNVRRLADVLVRVRSTSDAA